MTTDLADWAVKYATKIGASYAEARREKFYASGFAMKNGILEGSSFGEAEGMGIRFITKKTLGFISANILNKKTIKNLIDKSAKLTRASAKHTSKISLAPAQKVKTKYKVKEKIKLDSISTKNKIKVLQNIEKSLIRTKIKLPTRYFALSHWKTKKYFVNSEGTKIQTTMPKINVFYLFNVKHNNKSAQRAWQYGATSGWEAINKWKLPEHITNETREIHNNLKKGRKPPTGKLDLVLGPEVSGIIAHESCGHPFEADRILGREAAQAGESFVEPKMLGKRIGNSVVSVIEDPTIPGTYGFYLYDDEGVKARKRFLIKNGIINEFLHNRETAHTLKTKSNGSARASEYDKEAIVRMANTFIRPGDYKEEELIKDVKNGVYIKNFMEWNIEDKRFKNRYVGNESFLIKNGKLSYPIRNPAVEITTPALYSSIDAIGNNLEYHAGTCGKGEPMQGIPVTLGGPSIRLRNIKLSI